MDFLRSQSSNYTYYTSLLLISDRARHTFFGIFLVISVASLVGNVCAIYSISRRKYRYIQKTCIISLALSDLISTTSIGVNNLETFSHPLIDWTMGDFMCHLIPLCQFWGMVASSIGLVAIALDRYRNVIHALSKRWNPSLTHCVVFATIIWLITLGISFPMYTFFTHAAIGLVYPDNGHMKIVDSYVCVSFKEHEMMIFYIVMTFVIFLPLLLIFLWLYYNIAILIWKHRKPLSTIFNKKHKISESPNTKTETSTNQPDQVKSIMTKTKDVRVERKIRTFKIIVTLMLVFIICRLPGYVFNIMKLTNNIGGENIWIINYICIALGIVNSMLNPLLYTFLNQTLNVYARIKSSVNEFACEICCCCCSSTEFEDFEKGNPFVVECGDRNNSRVKFEDNKNNRRSVRH